jgi:hypothetical protein
MSHDKLQQFNWKIYLKFNPDLIKFDINNKKKATEHYNAIGKNENRKHCLKDVIPKDFNWLVYKAINNDLDKSLTKKQVFLHYIEHGIYENRSYKYIPSHNKIIDKNSFRKECTKELSILKNIELPLIPINSRFEAVFIEFRWYEHIELLLRNAILKFPNWSHTVFCGINNGDIMKNCCAFISNNIKVIVLEYDNLTPSQYSELLTTRSFWEKINGETILIHQEDSYIFHNMIDPFLKYDYVGAPWPEAQNDNLYGVGNGGFSLRNKNAMLKVIDTVNPHELQINSHTLKYIKNTKSTFLPEDVYFSKSLIDYNIGTVANRKIATEFSQETQLSKNPLGGHNFYLAGNNCDIDRYKGLRLLQDYYKLVDHRGGWNLVIKYGIENNIISTNREKDIIFIDCCEKYFLWDKNPPLQSKWIGILHTTPKVPNFLKDILALNKTLVNKSFKLSLSNCVALITLTKYQKEYTEKWLFNKGSYVPNIIDLKHPISTLTSEFNLDSFINQSKYNIVLLGQQLRKITDLLYIEKTDIINNKVWLSGIKDENVRYNIVKKEITGRNLPEQYLNEFFTTIILPYLNSFEEYDKLIQSSIIILPLYDAAANNSVLECIISNTPFFVEKNKGTEEYLGNDYPLFFNEIHEINAIIANKSILIQKYAEAHKYLKNIDKAQFRYNKFYSDILKFINNIE